MDKTLLNSNLGHAVVRVGEAGGAIGRQVADHVATVEWSRWVPEARRMLDLGAKLALARQGARAVADTTRRHPVAAAVTAAALAGIGVTIWLTRRRRAEVIEAEATTRKPARKRSATRPAAAKKSAARKSAAKSAAKKSAPRKRAAAKSSAKKSAAKQAAPAPSASSGNGAAASA